MQCVFDAKKSTSVISEANQISLIKQERWWMDLDSAVSQISGPYICNTLMGPPVSESDATAKGRWLDWPPNWEVGSG